MTTPNDTPYGYARAQQGYTDKHAMHRQEGLSRAQQELRAAAITLIGKLSKEMLPVKVPVSYDTYKALEYNNCEGFKSPERKELLRVLAEWGGVPAEKVRITIVSIEILP